MITIGCQKFLKTIIVSQMIKSYVQIILLLNAGHEATDYLPWKWTSCVILTLNQSFEEIKNETEGISDVVRRIN